jgi:hypothetical protein
MCYIFCTDGCPRAPWVRCRQYNPYQQIALGGFSMPCVGSAQRHWLHHSSYLRGGRVWALRCSTLQGDCHCATLPRPPRLVRPEIRVLWFSWARVCWVSRPSGVDRLLRPQAYSGGSLSIWVVSGREPTRPNMVVPYGPPSGAAFSSWATGRHTDTDSLP